MSTTFHAQVNEWCRKSQKRMERVAKTAALSVIEEAQTPVAKGGNMRVDTGFLRASGQVSLDGMPTGESRPQNPDDKHQADDVAVVATIGKAQLGDTIWFGWTAHYAVYREAFDGFLGLAVQKWQEHVDAAIRKVKSAGD